MRRRGRWQYVAAAAGAAALADTLAADGLRLQKLNLLNTKITDSGLVHLKGGTELQWLGLANTKVTDAGLVHLKGLTALQRLDRADSKASPKLRLPVVIAS